MRKREKQTSQERAGERSSAEELIVLQTRLTLWTVQFQKFGGRKERKWSVIFLPEREREEIDFFEKK